MKTSAIIHMNGILAERGETMAYIKRHMEEKILSLSKSWSAILVTGPRQAGKTTMLKRLMEIENKGRTYVSLDDLNLRALANDDPQMFLQLYHPPVLIDEVQYAPKLFTYIKIYVDEHHEPGAFWLTGSQIFRLMKGVQESMAGRVALLHLSPLSQREIIGASSQPFTTDLTILQKGSRNIKPLTIKEMFGRIWDGCMPGLIGGTYQDHALYYSSYLSTYIERDVRDLANEIEPLRFLRFVTSAAARVGQVLNYKSIADDAEITQAEAKDWLLILETLGITFRLYPYSNNVLKRTIKTPKLYFYDTGLVCYLTRWSSPAVAEVGAMNGAILENYTVSEIIKSYQNVGLEPYVNYYRDKDAKEIDVIVESDGKLCPLEIKKTATPEKRMLRSFGVLDKAPLQVGTGAVLCLASELGAFDREHLIIPIWMI